MEDENSFYSKKNSFVPLNLKCIIVKNYIARKEKDDQNAVYEPVKGFTWFTATK